MEYIDIDNIKMPTGLPKINFNKPSQMFEIAVPLFEVCNLNCGFCFESHDIRNIDIERIKKLDSILFPQLNNTIEESNADIINFNLWGGELFFDGLPDKIFEAYKIFIDRNVNAVERNFKNKRVVFSFMSNGVFTKYKRVEEVLDYYNNTRFMMSYDPVDRFSSDKQKEIWYNTLQHFNSLEYLDGISITLTKKNIYAYLNNDYYFEKIPSNQNIDVNYYTAAKNWEEYLPTDEDLYRFYKWGIDNNKFNINIIRYIIEHKIPELKNDVPRLCNCKTCTQLSENISSKDCAERSSLKDKTLFYGKYAEEINEENCTEAKNSIGILKRGCLGCEHFDDCTMFCWISIIFKEYKTKECPLKRIYKYVNEDVIKKYLTWKENRILRERYKTLNSRKCVKRGTK